MRTDYGLYVVAVVCFIIAGIFLTGAVGGYGPSDAMGPAAIAIFSILGVILAIAGYTIRPKVSVPTPAPSAALQIIPEPAAPSTLPPVEEKEEEPEPQTPQPPTPEEQAPPAPPEPEPEAPTPTIEETSLTSAPAPIVEEPAATVEEKPVRRRRKKKTA